MNTIKELQKTPNTNMMLEDGYLLALKDVIKLIDNISLDLYEESDGCNCCRIIKESIEG